MCFRFLVYWTDRCKADCIWCFAGKRLESICNRKYTRWINRWFGRPLWCGDVWKSKWWNESASEWYQRFSSVLLIVLVGWIITGLPGLGINIEHISCAVWSSSIVNNIKKESCQFYDCEYKCFICAFIYICRQSELLIIIKIELE